MITLKKSNFLLLKGYLLIGWIFVFFYFRRIPPLGHLYLRLATSALERSKLFDSDYYGKTVGVESEVGLEHYILYGDVKGCFPMPLFDPIYYRRRVFGRLLTVNTLLHYFYLGRFLNKAPCSWFDPAFYLSNNKDIKHQGLDPLLHFYVEGGKEGRSPCVEFDAEYYLKSNPSVLEVGLNPLVHYLQEGQYQGLSISGTQKGFPLESLSLSLLLKKNSWVKVSPCGVGGGDKLKIVVPLCESSMSVLTCIYRVLFAEYRSVDFDLVIIVTVPLQPILIDRLRELADLECIVLVEGGGAEKQLLRKYCGENNDFILLNPKTEVYGCWLERLRDAAYGSDYVGVVAPLSNNIGVSGYPLPLSNNCFPLELSFSELDGLAEQYNSGEVIEAFFDINACMYVRGTGVVDVSFRQCSSQMGAERSLCFSYVTRPYWRSVIAPNVFVACHDNVRLREKPSDFLEKNKIPVFWEESELFQSRASLDIARLRRVSKKKNILVVSHKRGGGTEQHIQEDTRSFIEEGYGVFFLRPVVENGTVTIEHPLVKKLPNLGAFDLLQQKELTQELRTLGVTEVHVHSLIDFHQDAPSLVLMLIKKLKVSWKMNIHDYEVICPRINLVDYSGDYCHEASIDSCNRCIGAREQPPMPAKNIESWRDKYKPFLLSAPHISCPDQDVADRLVRYFPEVLPTVSPHEDFQVPSPFVPAIQEGQVLRVVIIGAISKIKGAGVLLACALDAKKRGLPIRFSVLGHATYTKTLERAGVNITGRYLESQSLQRISQLNPHVCWFPAIWPETYSYTLSLALKSRLEVFAFDIGAIASRLKVLGRTQGVLPLTLKDSPGDINNAFMSFRMSHIQDKPEFKKKIL